MKMREESVPLSGGLHSCELVVERAEGRGGVVGLEAVPVMNGVERDAGQVVGVLRVHRDSRWGRADKAFALASRVRVGCVTVTRRVASCHTVYIACTVRYASYLPPTNCAPSPKHSQAAILVRLRLFTQVHHSSFIG